MESYFHIIYIFVWNKISQALKKYYYGGPFGGGPGVSLLNFEGGPGIPLLNFEGGPRSWDPDPTLTPCLIGYN